MSDLQLKAFAVLMNVLWWSGLLGLVVTSFFEGQYCFGTMCCLAMLIGLRWQVGLNAGSLKGLLKLVLKEPDRDKSARPYQ